MLLSGPQLRQQPLQNIVSYTLYAHGPCDALEHVPMFIGNQRRFQGEEASEKLYLAEPYMPKRDLWIIGAVLSMHYHGLSEDQKRTAWCLAGVANRLGGDYLVPIFY